MSRSISSGCRFAFAFRLFFRHAANRGTAAAEEAAECAGVLAGGNDFAQKRDQSFFPKWLVKLIGNEQLGKAVDEQAIVKTELNKLLELLMSEQGPKRLADEKERIKKYLQDVIRLIKDQTEIDDNINHGNPGQLAGRQDKIADRTKKVGDEIARNEGLGKTGDKKSGDGKSSDV